MVRQCALCFPNLPSYYHCPLPTAHIKARPFDILISIVRAAGSSVFCRTSSFCSYPPPRRRAARFSKMSYRTFSPYSTPARQPSGWPVYMQSPPQNHLNSHTNKNIGSNHNTFQTPKSIAMPIPKLAEQKAPVPSMTPAQQVQVHRWIPPTRPESPDEFPWRTPIFSEGDSASTASTSSSDDDESPAETSQPLAPKPTLSSA
ncbi:hypothetical protein FRC18_005748, partial [Serendipita sp. 400]